VSVKAPRLIAHQEGLKYHTHTYLVKEEKEDELWANLGWDQQSLGNMKDFWQRVPVESCSITIKHIGLQKKRLEHRQEQVKEERSKVEVLDHRLGLNFTGDAHKSVDRITQRMHKTWVKDAIVRGMKPLTYDQHKMIVAKCARDWEKKQQILRQTSRPEKVKLTCDKCGFISTNMLMQVNHMQEGCRG
jgi:histidyl-tRNA synthetase